MLLLLVQVGDHEYLERSSFESNCEHTTYHFVSLAKYLEYGDQCVTISPYDSIKSHEA